MQCVVIELTTSRLAHQMVVVSKEKPKLFVRVMVCKVDNLIFSTETIRSSNNVEVLNYVLSRSPNMQQINKGNSRCLFACQCARFVAK